MVPYISPTGEPDVPDLRLDPVLINDTILETLSDEVAPELARPVGAMNVVETVRTEDCCERVEELNLREGLEVCGDNAVQ